MCRILNREQKLGGRTAAFKLKRVIALGGSDFDDRLEPLLSEGDPRARWGKRGHIGNRRTRPSALKVDCKRVSVKRNADQRRKEGRSRDANWKCSLAKSARDPFREKQKNPN